MENSGIKNLGKKKSSVNELVQHNQGNMQYSLCLEKKVLKYTKENIRSPTLHQILQWAKPLGVHPTEAKAVSDRAPYRHRLGESQRK